MIQRVLIQILLSPVALLYAIGITLRNLMYRIGFLKSVSFSFPVISIGNLSVGGTGKTPHIEFLIRTLGPYIPLAVMSRGYGRKTKGLMYVQPNQDATVAGDEPLQIKRKYPGVLVAVVENRALGIPSVLKSYPQVKTILLDDAFQHKPITPGLNILLTDYNRLFTRDFLLPVGRLREWRSAYRRADSIIVTKCPTDLTPDRQKEIMDEINPLPHQKIFFSFFTYLHPYFLWNPQRGIVLRPSLTVLLISAIANTEYLKAYLESKVDTVHSVEFEDHHYFTNYDMGQLENQFQQIPGNNKIILTTEKDATRLQLHRDYLITKKLPIFVLPIAISFHPSDSGDFADYVKSFLLAFKV